MEAIEVNLDVLQQFVLQAEPGEALRAIDRFVCDVNPDVDCSYKTTLLHCVVSRAAANGPAWFAAAVKILAYRETDALLPDVHGVSAWEQLAWGISDANWCPDNMDAWSACMNTFLSAFPRSVHDSFTITLRRREFHVLDDLVDPCPWLAMVHCCMDADVDPEELFSDREGCPCTPCLRAAFGERRPWLHAVAKVACGRGTPVLPLQMLRDGNTKQVRALTTLAFTLLDTLRLAISATAAGAPAHRIVSEYATLVGLFL